VGLLFNQVKLKYGVFKDQLVRIALRAALNYQDYTALFGRKLSRPQNPRNATRRSPLEEVPGSRSFSAG
jgi:hypothetical protein